MKHIVVDLEMNNVNKKSGAAGICRMEVIEIGAVMLDDNLNEIAAFRTYVKPQYNDQIVSKISRLTGITTEMVENAPKFQEASNMFANWCYSTGNDVYIYAWSDSDYKQMVKELEFKKIDFTENEARLVSNEWNDFQQEFDKRLGFDRRISLKLALDMAGIDFDGRQHDALDDARNTAELFQLFKDAALFDKTLKKIEEAMKPKSLENTLGSMFDMAMFAVA